MRRIAWVFALFGATGLAGRPMSAAEPSTRTRLGQAPKAAAALPESERAADAPRSRQLKNYSDELFGTEPGKATASPGEGEGTAVVKSKSAPWESASKDAAPKGAPASTGDADRKDSPTAKVVPAPATAHEKDAEWDFLTAKDPFTGEVELSEGPASKKTPSTSGYSFSPRGKDSEKPATVKPAAVATAAADTVAADTEVAAPESAAPAFSKNSIVPVAGEAAPWAKSRVQSAEYDTQAGTSETRRLTPAAGTRTPASATSFSPRGTAATPVPAKSSTPTNRLSAPIDIDSAEGFDTDEPEPDVIPQRKSSLTIARPPVTDRPRNPVGVPAPANAFRPGSTPAAAPVAVVAPAKASAEVPNVTVTWRSTGSINIGQECTCQLVVKNHGSAAAADVQIEATFPKNVRLIGAEPKPASQTGFLGWGFDSLEAGEEKIISVKLVPTQRGQIETDARVRFSGKAKTTFTVAEPMLALKVEGPKEVLVGDPAAHNVLITNPGTGVATNVKIEAVIPKGLEHAKGERLVMDLGSLNPGETRNIRLACAAVAGGSHKIQVRAIADADLTESAASEVSVIAPQIKAAIEGPGLRYLGRNGVFHIHVSNEGAAATDNVRVLHKVPEGFDFVSAGAGAAYDAGNRLLSCYVGHLEPGQKSDIEVTLVAAKAGEFTHFIRATSESGAVNDSQLTTRVEGSPALVMSIRDLDDPVEVGVETAYEIKVKNEGSAAASNVGLTLELPQGLQFLQATGPSAHAAEKGLVTFRPVGQLGPGESATFTLKVKGQASGNVRLRSRLTSDSIEEPIVADESTKFYQ